MTALWNLLRYVLGVRCVGCLYGMPETHGRRLWWCRGHAERLKKWGTFAENFERGLREGMAEDPREAPTVKTRREPEIVTMEATMDRAEWERLMEAVSPTRRGAEVCARCGGMLAHNVEPPREPEAADMFCTACKPVEEP
jgi:hypothetical protein